MTLPLSGTGAVTNGEALVTWTGAILTAFNCVPGTAAVIDGVTYFVQERISTTEFSLTRNYAGADDTDAPCEIGQITPDGVKTATLHTTVAAYNARLALLQADGKGLYYTLLGVTGANDPGPGKLARNASAWADATALYLDVLDAGGFDATPLIDAWDTDTIVTVRSIETRAYAAFRLTAPVIDEDDGEWRQVAGLAFLGGAGILADGEDVAIEWNRTGRGLDYDEQVDDIAGREAFDEAEAGLRVLVSDTGDGRAAVYTLRVPGDPATWSAPAYATGPAGADGATVPEVLTALGINSITISEDPPSGGVDNDVWLQIPPA